MEKSADIIRHKRHILLKEIGGHGQKLIANSHVAIIGMGGLGCPCALYLAVSYTHLDVYKRQVLNPPFPPEPKTFFNLSSIRRAKSSRFCDCGSFDHGFCGLPLESFFVSSLLVFPQGLFLGLSSSSFDINDFPILYF